MRNGNKVNALFDPLFISVGKLVCIMASLGYFIDGFSHILIPGNKTGAAFLAIPIALSEADAVDKTE